MKRGLQGRYLRRAVAVEPFNAYLPSPLPPDPPLQLDPSLWDLLEHANRALGRLDGLAALLPDPYLFLYFYVRKEAVVSSQIEGTQSSLSDLLLFESHATPGVPLHDVQEVSRYVAALNHGLERIRGGFPLSLRLLREVHEILLAGARGGEKMPGEFRTSQNWIGGTRPGNALFVPLPPEEMMNCLGELELFLHDQKSRTPLLLKAALTHVQFETTHPFLDGNGRLGRLLIPLLLCAEDALSQPLLYLSLYFKAHRQEYYDLLQAVRIDGDWEVWLEFFLAGVRETADQAVATARRILDLFEEDRLTIEARGAAAGSMLRVHDLMRRSPLVSARRAAESLSISEPTAASALKYFEGIALVHEVTGRSRGRIYAYTQYLALLAEGTEPLPPGPGTARPPARRRPARRGRPA